MIIWAIRRKYKGAERWTIYPHYRRNEVRQVARMQRASESNPGAKTTVHKAAFNVLPTCGCRLIDDVPVFCRRHTTKGGGPAE